MTCQEVVEDAIVNRQICSAQAFFQSRIEAQMVGHEPALFYFVLVLSRLYDCEVFILQQLFWWLLEVNYFRLAS